MYRMPRQVRGRQRAIRALFDGRRAVTAVRVGHGRAFGRRGWSDARVPRTAARAAAVRGYDTPMARPFYEACSPREERGQHADHALDDRVLRAEAIAVARSRYHEDLGTLARTISLWSVARSPRTRIASERRAIYGFGPALGRARRSTSTSSPTTDRLARRALLVARHALNHDVASRSPRGVLVLADVSLAARCAAPSAWSVSSAKWRPGARRRGRDRHHDAPTTSYASRRRAHMEQWSTRSSAAPET